MQDIFNYLVYGNTTNLTHCPMQASAGGSSSNFADVPLISELIASSSKLATLLCRFLDTRTNLARATISEPATQQASSYAQTLNSHQNDKNSIQIGKKKEGREENYECMKIKII